MDDDEPPIELRQEPDSVISFRSRPKVQRLNERPLPASIEAEKAVLSSVFLNPSCLSDLQDIEEKHFHHPAYGMIWKCLMEMKDGEIPINLITVTQKIADKNLFSQIGGPSVLAEIQCFLPTGDCYAYYSSTVLEKYRRRKAIALMQKSIEEMYQSEETAATESIASTIQELRPMLDFGSASVPHIKQFAEASIDNIEMLARNKGAVIGVPTGFRQFDRILGGLKPGNFAIIAARPSMGKTSLGLNISVNAAKSGVPVLFFTLEMSETELFTRMICSESNIGLEDVRNGELNRKDLAPMGNSASSLQQLPIYVEGKSAITISDFRLKCRQMKKSNDIGLIVVDYIQLMRSDSRKAQNSRYVEVTEISNCMKETAKDLKIPIIGLAQLNRDIEKRKDAKPMMSDLKDSGSLEQDADIVMLLHRDKKEQSEDAFVFIAKNRGGVAGDTVKLWFDGKTTSFRHPQPKPTIQQEY